MAREHELVDHFVVMHSGNVGHAQGIETLVRAAAMLRDLDRLEVVVIGFGARHAAAVELAASVGATNVRFLPYQPRERLPETLASADVHYLGLAEGLAGYVVPSRLNGILAAARPVLVAADANSESSHVVADAACGLRVPPGDPNALAAAIRQLAAGAIDLPAAGAAGRSWVEQHRSRSDAIARYEELLGEILSGSR